MTETRICENQIPPKRRKLMTYEPEPRSTVLVIYTGGTIGMETNDEGGLQNVFSFNYCTLVDSIQAHFKTIELTKI